MPRPKGVKETKPRNTAAKKTAALAHEQGVTPLDVMLTAMREDWAAAQEMAGTALPSDPAQAQAYIDRMAHLRASAILTADKAAPYLHPRLASTDTTIKSDNVHRVVADKPVSIDEWVAEHGTPANDAASVDDADAS